MKISLRVISVMLILAVLAGFSVFAEPPVDASAGNTFTEAQTDDIAAETGEEDLSFARFSYYDYKALYSDASKDSSVINIDASSYTAASGDVKAYTDADADLPEDKAHRKGKSIITSETSYVEWTVVVPKTALYVMNVDYYTVNLEGVASFESKGSDIERSLYIDGELPFTEAAGLSFQRQWKDAGEIKQDVYGHDIRPESVEINTWLNTDCHDAGGLFDGPFSFYLTEGTHIIRLVSVKEPMVINEIKFYTPEALPTYDELLADYKAKGYKEVATAEADPLKTQAENINLKSSSTIYASYDRVSVNMEPSSHDLIKINMVSGGQFSKAYQWISWRFDVEKAGLYKINMRFKQSARDGAFCNRTIKINGEVPCQEARNIRFYYDNAWQVSTVSTAGGEEMLFYFDEGVNTVAFQVNLGEFADAASRIAEIVYELNKCYRQIVMITGSSPDTFRDYGFRSRIPGTLESMEENLEALKALKSDIEKFTNQTGSFTSVFNSIMVDLESMVDKPRTIAQKLDSFKTNLGSLSTWQLDITSQPVSFDWIEVSPVDNKLPKAEAGFFKSVAFQFKMFMASFYMDYNNVGTTKASLDSGDRTKVSVWIATGRDQFQIIKRLVDNNLAAYHQDIAVDLKLVAGGTLLPAVLAGIGPDVSLQSGNADPLNYAIRNAVIDVSQFEGFDAVKNRFSEAALVPYTYKDKVYALPETFTFNMLFYRKDILSEQGLSIPQTWDQVYNCMVKLNMNSMFFGIMPTIQTFSTLLYQNGGSFYNGDGTASALDTSVAISTFEKWTEFHTAYSTLVDFDFANRFRTGEMPLGIADYTLYNQLSVFATEIKGLWGFTSLPGTLKVDGNGESYIDRSTAAAGTACIILSGAKEPEAAWKFIEWWTSTDAQVKYGREIESLQGIAGRHATANIEALSMLAWDVEDYNALIGQWEWAKAIPEYPGSYILGRYVDFAFRKVVNEAVDPGQQLLEYVEQINDELTRKRAEFEK